MPTYEYRCSDCGNLFEVQQRIDDDPLTVCERCGGRLRKVFHPAGIVFKGSGFYATDSRSKRAGSKDKVDSTSDSNSGSKSDSKSDSRSDSKSDSGSNGKKETASSEKRDSKGSKESS